MNVLIFTNLFPSTREPWRGLFNLRRFHALAAFCQVHVVAPVPAWKRFQQPADLVRPPSGCIEGIAASYPTSWTLPRVMPQWHAAQAYRSVRSHVQDVRREFPFDVVLGAFAYPDAVIASRLASDAGCPFVALVMGSDMNDLAQRPNLRGLVRSALSSAAHVVCVSTALQRRVLELGIAEERTTVQHNGVDGGRFQVRDRSDARRTLGLDGEQKLVVFIGNLVHEKGPDVLVEALGQLRSNASPDFRVVFIGDGPQKPALLSSIAASGVGAQVSFLGRRPPGEVALWLAASDVLCLPSRREGCPNVVLEALASGRPVVAAAVGGVPELLNTGNGVMVPPDDPKALAEALSGALRRSWTPSELRLSVPALTWEDVGRRLFDVLTQATSPRDSARRRSR